MSIPLPTTGSGGPVEYKSKCELYDGNRETGGLCNGWITKTNTCTRRTDELGKTCDGYGKFPS